MKYEQRIKILYVISNLANRGPVNQLYNLIKNIDKKLFSVEILTLSKEDRNSRIDDFYNLDINVNSLNIPHKKHVLYKKVFFNKIKEINPDIVHSHGLRSDYFNSLLKKMGKIITFSTLHNYAYVDYKYSYGTFIGKYMAKRHLNFIQDIQYPVACSATIKEILLKRHHIKVDFVQNSADETKFFYQDKCKKSLFREKLNLDKEKVIFIYVGNLTKLKNLGYLINAFNMLEQKFQLLLVGDGNLKGKLEKKSSSNIKFLGRKDNVQEYLWASDVYVSPSLTEGLPTAVLEAMGCGLPLLLSDIPQHREIIDKNFNMGDLFSLDNQEELINKIKIYSSKYVLEEKAKASNDTFKKFFTSKRMTLEYTTLYEIAIKNNRTTNILTI